MKAAIVEQIRYWKILCNGSEFFFFLYFFIIKSIISNYS